VWRLDNLAATRNILKEKSMGENIEAFTDGELLVLSEGIRSLVANADKALRLVRDEDVHRVISQKLQEYSDLDVKLCMMMGKIG